MSKLYLTIDDGPSKNFRELVDFLHENAVPALFFNRGDHMRLRPDDVIYGIHKGFVMGNHAYGHKRASTLSFSEVCAEILKTESILDDLYRQAGAARPGKYFRFPYMDRGMGPWLVNPEGLVADYSAPIEDLIRTGLGHDPSEKPDEAAIEKAQALQEFLKKKRFTPPPRDVHLPWYTETEMGKSIDWLCTYSTSDWAVTARHKGQHGFENTKDLKAKIDHDPYLRDKHSAHIILAHDQEEIYGTVCALVEHFLEHDFEFLDFDLIR